MSRPKRFFEKAGLWFHDHGLDAMWEIMPWVLAFVLFAVSDEALRFVPDHHDDDIRIYGIGAAVFLAILIPAVVAMRMRKAKRVSSLEDRIDELTDKNFQSQEAMQAIVQDVRNIAGGYLLDLSELLEFGKHKPCVERATIYIRDSETGFRAVRRLSSHPELSGDGRSSYPVGEGCIGKAWREGHHFYGDGPCPENDEDEYYAWQKALGVNKTVARKFKMQSRLYFAWRIRDRNKVNPLAVLVVEVTEPDRFTEKQLLTFFENQQGRYLSDLLSAMEPQLPDSSVARERDM